MCRRHKAATHMSTPSPMRTRLNSSTRIKYGGRGVPSLAPHLTINPDRVSYGLVLSRREPPTRKVTNTADMSYYSDLRDTAGKEYFRAQDFDLLNSNLATFPMSLVRL